MEHGGSLPCSYEVPTELDGYSAYPIPLRSILILSSHLRLGSVSGFFPCGFPNTILYEFLICSMSVSTKESFNKHGPTKIRTGVMMLLVMIG